MLLAGLCTLAEVARVIGLIGFRVSFVSSSSVDVGWDKCGGGCQKSRNSPGDAVPDEKKRRGSRGADRWRGNRGNRVMRGRRTGKSQKEKVEETVDKGEEVNFAVRTDRPVGGMREREEGGGQ